MCYESVLEAVFSVTLFQPPYSVLECPPMTCTAVVVIVRVPMDDISGKKNFFELICDIIVVD